MALLRTLFAIENQAREASATERLAIRQKQSVPVLAELRQRLLVWKEQLLPQHPMADAVNYTLNHWAELNVFCSDGAVPIDNNASEREMKRMVLNRKNSLFVGNPRGGRTAAILASLTSTCRRHQPAFSCFALSWRNIATLARATQDVVRSPLTPDQR